MAARSTATVSVMLGLMEIVLKLYISAERDKVEFNQINSKTGNKIKRKPVDAEAAKPQDPKMIDSITLIEVPAEDICKGYEYKKGSFITFTKEEFDSLQGEDSNNIDIAECIPADQINPIHIERTLYAGPDKGQDAGYELLYQLLNSSNKAAVGVWHNKGKDSLVMIRAYEHGLVMHQMFFNSDIRSFDDSCDHRVLSTEELTMGQMLIEKLSVDKFDSTKYYDLFLDKLNKIVADKTKQENSTESKLAAALKGSLVDIGVTKKEIKGTVSKAKKEKKTA